MKGPRIRVNHAVKTAGQTNGGQTNEAGQRPSVSFRERRRTTTPTSRDSD